MKRRPGQRQLPRPEPLHVWGAPANQNKFVTRGELLSVLDMHHRALQESRWYLRAWRLAQWLVRLHPKQRAMRRLKAAQEKAALTEQAIGEQQG